DGNAGGNPIPYRGLLHRNLLTVPGTADRDCGWQPKQLSRLAVRKHRPSLRKSVAGPDRQLNHLLRQRDCTRQLATHSPALSPVAVFPRKAHDLYGRHSGALAAVAPSSYGRMQVHGGSNKM